MQLINSGGSISNIEVKGQRVSFFTPIEYQGKTNLAQKIWNGIEDYFYLAGKKAVVIKCENGRSQVRIEEVQSNKALQVLLGALKVMSYITLIFPLIFLFAKIAFRTTHKFEIKNEDSIALHEVKLPENKDSIALPEVKLPENKDRIALTEVELPKNEDSIALPEVKVPENKDSIALPEDEPPKKEDIIALTQAINLTSPIDSDFTASRTIVEQRIVHTYAWMFLMEKLPMTGATVSFMSPPPLSAGDVPKLAEVQCKKDLDSAVFTWTNTQGVQGDIQRDGKRTDNTSVYYGAASEFTGAEAPDKFTVQPGRAVETYRTDLTQGPQAQIQFPAMQVELINCAANRGYNGLCKLLDESTKSAVAHGYFTPDESQADAIIEQLRNQGHLIEYPCIRNKPISGTAEVNLMLVSAPAFGKYAGSSTVKGEKRKEIQFLCAWHSFRAQFRHIKKNLPSQNPIVFKPAAVGLGVFENDPQIVAKAFYHAAKIYEKDFKENNVSVSLQVFRGVGPAREMADALGLTESR